MHTLIVVGVLFGGGAIVTLIGRQTIEWLHPPRGRFIDVGDARQHVVELGPNGSAADGKPPIVLLHGAGCNLEDMRLALGERLAARHRVILVDRPGLGWSERKGRQASSPAYQAAILRDVFDRLEVDRAIVVGHSWGGALATRFTLDHPQRVAGLALLAPATHPRFRRMTRFYAAVATPFVGWLNAHTLALPFGVVLIGLAIRTAFLPQMPPRAYLGRSAAMLLLRPATFLANACDVGDLKSYLVEQVPRYPKLEAPTIVITGDRDAIVSPRQHSIAFAAAVPHAKLSILPGLGHMLHHVAAERIVAAIEELASATASSPLT
jgi:pimeloyl-ACP methyl ester carboxylesterase